MARIGAFLFLFLQTFHVLPGFAAIRTIQFGGTSAAFISLSRSSHAMIPSTGGRSIISGTTQFSQVCGVIITNTGSTRQRITSMKFSAFAPLEFRGGVWSEFTDLRNFIYNPSGSTATTPSCPRAGARSACLNQTIEAGGIFVSQMNVPSGVLAAAPLQNTGFIPCFGEFTIQDEDPTRPGSAVATGFISSLSEMGILGGQFHGAIYMSGSNVPMSEHVARRAIMTGTEHSTRPLPFGWEGTMQMNLYCSQACQAVRNPTTGVPLSRSFCSPACGMLTDGVLSGPGTPVETESRNILGFLEESSDTAWWGQRIRTSADPPPGDPSNSCSEMRIDPAHRLHTVESPNFFGLLRTANPRWAGGHVVEVILGPFDSICSGNEEYFTRGGFEFLHNETIDSDDGLSMANTRDPARGLPERLFCAHRHNQSYLNGYLASGVQFTINGGMAF